MYFVLAEYILYAHRCKPMRSMRKKTDLLSCERNDKTENGVSNERRNMIQNVVYRLCIHSLPLALSIQLSIHGEVVPCDLSCQPS